MASTKNSKADSDKEATTNKKKNQKNDSTTSTKKKPESTDSIKQKGKASEVGKTNSKKNEDVGLKEIVQKVQKAFGKEDKGTNESSKKSTSTKKGEEKIIKPDTYDYERKFEIIGKAEFLDGALKLGQEGGLPNYIRRTEPFRYELSGMMTDGTTPYTFPFDCDQTTDEGDIMWKELIAYEKEQKNSTKKSETKKTTDNAKAAQPLPTAQQFTPPKPENIDQKAIITKRLTEYGNALSDTIKGSIQARLHGGMPTSEAMRVLSAASKEFKYTIETEGGSKHIVLSQGEFSVKTQPLPIV